jgi:anti-sigma B factor antagonist
MTKETQLTEESRLILNQDGEVTVVGFSEPNLLDAYHINDCAKELYELIEKRGHRWIVLDLATVKMLSSQSLGVFLNIRHKLDALEGKVVISGIDPRLSRVFKITNLQSVFEFFPDTSAAVAELKKCINV